MLTSVTLFGWQRPQPDLRKKRLTVAFGCDPAILGSRKRGQSPSRWNLVPPIIRSTAAPSTRPAVLYILAKLARNSLSGKIVRATDERTAIHQHSATLEAIGHSAAIITVGT